MNFSDPNIIIDELRMEISRVSVGNSNNLSLFLRNARKACFKSEEQRWKDLLNIG